MNTKRGTFTLSNVGGIAIKAHWSWLIIFALFTWSLATGQFPQDIPGQTAISYWALGLIGALMLFLSVLIHELSHSFTARVRGYKVSEIILFIFGGVSNIEEEPKKPGDEFIITVVGPLSSFLLAGIFYVLAQVLSPPVGRVATGAAAILQYLALINLILGAFNMIPGFPLDGGRVLRSIIWGATHNFQRATKIAGGVGQVVAYLLIAWGLFQTFYLDNFGGLWIAFIGWFLLSAAQQSTTSVAVKKTMRGITVGQVMEPPPPAAAPQMTLAQLLTQYILSYNLRTVHVTQDSRLVGVITLNDIKHIPQDQWGTVTVGTVMIGVDKVRTVKPQDALESAMQHLTEGDSDQVPVIDNAGQLVGVLTRARILRWLQIRDELHQSPDKGQAA